MGPQFVSPPPRRSYTNEQNLVNIAPSVGGFLVDPKHSVLFTSFSSIDGIVAQTPPESRDFDRRRQSNHLSKRGLPPPYRNATVSHFLETNDGRAPEDCPKGGRRC
jgi:hypothetical protein